MRRLLSALPLALIGLLLIPAAATAAPPPATAAGFLDARAAAAKSGDVKDGAATAASWSTGTLAAGATQSWTWNNANPLNTAYKVGFSPFGATSVAECSFGVERQWYSQQSSGERRFHFVIKNRSSIACGATVLLAGATGTSLGTSGWLNPGAYDHRFVTVPGHTGDPHTRLAGLSPIGAVGANACQIEVSGEWSVDRLGGSREFHVQVLNVGTIPCAVNITVAALDAGLSDFAIGNIKPVASASAVWFNANPLNAVYVPLIEPFVKTAGQSCTLELTDESYVQTITSTGAPMRMYRFTVRNFGSYLCQDVHVTLPTLAG